MNSSPTFKWLITVLVPLTLGWKLIVGGTTSSESKIKIDDFLSRQGLEVTRKTWGEYSFIDATTAGTDACRMILFEVSPDGWNRHVARQIFGATQRQLFLFRGSTYTEQPTWLTFSDHLWSRSLRKLGFARRDAPVIAVSATGPCAPEQLPWDELSFRTGEAPSPNPG